MDLLLYFTLHILVEPDSVFDYNMNDGSTAFEIMQLKLKF